VFFLNQLNHFMVIM